MAVQSGRRLGSAKIKSAPGACAPRALNIGQMQYENKVDSICEDLSLDDDAYKVKLKSARFERTKIKMNPAVLNDQSMALLK